MISWNIEFLELKPSIARPKIFWTKISAWDNDIFSLDCLDLDSTLASRVEDLNIDKFWPVLFVNKWFEITFPFWAQQYLILSKIQQNHALVSPFFSMLKVTSIKNRTFICMAEELPSLYFVLSTTVVMGISTLDVHVWNMKTVSNISTLVIRLGNEFFWWFYLFGR